MYYSLSLLAGAITALMLVLNGRMNQEISQGVSLVIIHVMGLLAVILYMVIKREKPVKTKLPLIWYVGGFIGIVTTIFNISAFGHISVSAMMALALLGESLSGVLSDHVGFLGVPVRRFRAEKLLGVLFLLIGAAVMLEDFALVPVIMSFLAGGTVLLSRLVNARLARKAGLSTTILINYMVGILGAVIVLFFMGLPEKIAFTLPFYNYLGGAIGALVVIISTFVVGRIATFYITLFMFIGQVFSGVFLDYLLDGAFSVRIALGGVFVLIGLVINLLQDNAYNKKNNVANQSDSLGETAKVKNA
ncbi:MAG: DMT family transporter [Bacillota bacterium]|nr:DMT family transporter [Bacillota bacterium]